MAYIKYKILFFEILLLVYNVASEWDDARKEENKKLEEEIRKLFIKHKVYII